jgi:hypothetical protein
MTAKPSWVSLVGATLIGAGVAGVAGWHLHLQTLHRQIDEKRSALSKLVLSGRIPPNQEVVDYLTSRQASLERRYQQAASLLASVPVAEAAITDPQLYFQEQLHEVQRTLERLATARSLSPPEALGFPKELPPSDTVPRLLVQLALMQDAAKLILGQGVTSLASLKVEDPEMVPEQGRETPFLMRLPVRVRFSGSLPVMMKVLAAFQQAKPIIDLAAVRMTAGAPDQPLEAEVVVARYLVVAPSIEAESEAGASEGKGARTKDRRPPASKKTGSSSKQLEE